MSPRRKRICPDGATVALFIEGGDEERMVNRLYAGPPPFVVCFDGRGEPQLRDLAAAATNDPGWPGIRRVGVVLDAEEDLAAAWALIGVVFEVLGCPRPSAMGLVDIFGDWRVGGFVLPDNASTGASESLLLRAASPAVLACIDALFTCTPNPGSNAAQRDKARAQVLAAATIPGARPDQLWGRADPGAPAFALLRGFLADLAR